MAHQRNGQPDGKLCGTTGIATARLCYHNPALLCRSEVNVVGVVTGLRENPKVRELIEESTGKPGTLAIGNQSVKSAQQTRVAQRGGKNPDIGSLLQPPQASGLFICLMDIIEYRDTHVFTSRR